MKRLILALILGISILSCSETEDSRKDKEDIGVGDIETTDIGHDGSMGDIDNIDKGEGIFKEGCPIKNKAIARKISDSETKMKGLSFTAIGGQGDYLLMNEKAAYVISKPGNDNAYYLYGGILIDAIAVKGCNQVALEDFEELGIIVGKLNTTDFSSSILRMFRGDTIEIINNGSDGKPAIIRVIGTDDTFWLVEGELMKMALSDGKERKMSEPLGIEIIVDYILPPDSPVLNIKITFKNKSNVKKSFISGIAVFFGDSTPVKYFSSSAIEVEGFRIDQGIPWIYASDNVKSYAISWKNANMSTMEVIGVTGIVDGNQLLSPIELDPMGSANDSKTITVLFSVGEGGSNSATREFIRFNPTPIPNVSYELHDISGKVLDSKGMPMPNVRVEFMAKSPKRGFMPLEDLFTNDLGEFFGRVAIFSDPQYQYQISVKIEGYPETAPLIVQKDNLKDIIINVPDTGFLKIDIKDDLSRNTAARLSFYDQNENLSRVIYTASGKETIKVAPGSYRLIITKGYEYQYVERDVKIEAGKTTEVIEVINRVVDTKGYLSTDTHVHASPSPDNTISIKDRIVTIAAEGLDVSVTTDHEFINSWKIGIDESGLDDFIINYPGEEVTASIPEHHNIYPVEPDYKINARGGYVKWFGLDIAELHKAMRERGAPIIQINHPYEYMENIGFDNERCKPILSDPTRLGLSQNAKLWDWDFDVWEMMNGTQNPFNNNNGGKGTFDNFMCFINHGYLKTAVGASDAHNWDIPGTPRIFFVSETDDPIKSKKEVFIDSIKKGKVIISTGAFAEALVNNIATAGDLITDVDKEIEVRLKIQALPDIDVSHFIIFVNCDSVANIKTTYPNSLIKYDASTKITLERDSSIVIAGFGKNKLPKGFAQFNPNNVPRFFINPIYIDVDGNGKFDPPGDKICNYSLTEP
ncbi:MAG: CehA/McbA family metallohydrolase [Deltaproteobacteria bacterium]|nr:CehA/McbA family metallohydrolase [Deltaproteobacteria bacterium]